MSEKRKQKKLFWLVAYLLATDLFAACGGEPTAPESSGVQIENIEEDFRDGLKLMLLLEVISGELDHWSWECQGKGDARRARSPWPRIRHCPLGSATLGMLPRHLCFCPIFGWG